MGQGLIYGKLEETELKLNPKEMAARLNTEVGFTNILVQQCETELRKALDCRYAATMVLVSFPQEDVVELDGVLVKSHSLYRNLLGCTQAFLFAVTLGMGTERLLNRLSMLSGAEFFITDALSSAMAEAACDAAEEKIRDGFASRPRFSPGYGDLSLEIQPMLLDRIQGQKLLGITLGASYLMSPMKSITAIMGVYHEDKRCDSKQAPVL